MDRSDFRYLISLINRAGLAWYEDELSHIRCCDRAYKLQFSYWNGTHRRRLSGLTAAPATRVSSVHRTGLALRTSPPLDRDHPRHRADDFFTLWILLGPLGSLTASLRNLCVPLRLCGLLLFGSFTAEPQRIAEHYAEKIQVSTLPVFRFSLRR